MKPIRGAGGLAGVGLVVAAWLAVAQESRGPSTSANVAMVGSLPVTRDEFERRAAPGRAEFQKRRSAELPAEFESLLERQVLESLIRANLLALEARRTGITVSEAEAEALLKQDPFFNPGGKFDPTRFLGIKTNDPAGYRRAIDRLRLEGAGRKLAERVQSKHRPEEAKIRQRAERALSSASIDVMLLNRHDFSGDYPEPREAEILEYYRRHPNEFLRPARASLSIIRFGATEEANPSLARRHADSTLAALQAGGSFDAAAAAFGDPLRVVVLPGNFPGYWKGAPRQDDAVFRLTAGSILPELVAADRGLLLVRVDERVPAGLAPLREVAPGIRAMLREEARLHHEDRELSAIYAARRESLRGPAYRLRYAAVDTGRVDPGEPNAAALDRFYRAHQADYTSYDAATASIRIRPLAEVRDEVRLRWAHDQRQRLAQATVEGLERVWAQGRRDRALERAATLLREVGPVPIGALADTGLAGRAVSDSVARRGARLGVGVAAYRRGFVVYQVIELVPDHAPSFEQIRSVLAEQRRKQREAEDERAARALFDREPERFRTGNVLHFTRVTFSPPEAIDVPLTRAEIERYHAEHIDRYSAPEEIRARHILISPEAAGPEADAAARAKAADLLRRIREGEDFAALARDHSDDPPTKATGGDLGFFSRGAMLEAFERAAFALRPGDVSEPVKTEVGYHLIKLMDRNPMVAEPIERIYANVGAEAAAEKGLRMSARLADSVYQLSKTPADARAIAQRLGVEIGQYRHNLGSIKTYPDHLRQPFLRLETLPKGKLYPGVIDLKSGGSALLWPDSVTAARAPRWEEARGVAIDFYLREAGQRALSAKRAELDSMLASGWSPDSLAELWGGFERVAAHRPGTRIRMLGSTGPIDSLVFGGLRAPALEAGQVSDWVDLANGWGRVRLNQRNLPSASQLANRMESERRLGLERSLFDYYEDLKKRYTVRILDPKLRSMTLPPPPPETTTP